MKIHCSLRLVVRTVVAAFLAGTVVGGALAGYSFANPESGIAPPARSDHSLVADGRIIGGISSSAGPAR